MNFITRQEFYTTAEIKKEAKAQLKGQWPKAFIMALVPVIFSVVFYRSTTDGQTWGLVLDLVRDFLLLGMTFGFMNLLRNKEYILEPLQEIAAPFRAQYFSKLFLLKLLKYLYIFLWTLLLIIPGIVKAYSYSQAELIYKDSVDRTGEQPSARACLAESQKLMDGHKAELFGLNLSFIGWVLLSGLTFGLLNLWLTPYMVMSEVIFYENITRGYYLQDEPTRGQTMSDPRRETHHSEEVGQDPNDFRDFDDF